MHYRQMKFLTLVTLAIILYYYAWLDGKLLQFNSKIFERSCMCIMCTAVLTGRNCMCAPDEILPLDRYIRAVTICNNLALLASQGTVAQFLQRVAVLSQLQRYWTKGFDTVQLSCAEADALPPDSDGDDDDGDLASLVPVSSVAEWEVQSDSTIDLKPDISIVVADGNESENVQLTAEQNADARDNGVSASK